MKKLVEIPYNQLTITCSDLEKFEEEENKNNIPADYIVLYQPTNNK